MGTVDADVVGGLSLRVCDCDLSPYERAVAATRVGFQLELLDAEAAREVINRSSTIEDALLELVGYASRQQRLWQLWARPASPASPTKSRQQEAGKLDDEQPRGVELSVEDARTMRQNCAQVLALLMALRSGAAAEIKLQSMRPLPEAIDARELREEIRRKDALDAQKHRPPVKTIATPIKHEEEKVRVFDDESRALELALIASVSAPDLGVARLVERRDLDFLKGRGEPKTGPEQRLADYLKKKQGVGSLARLYDHEGTVPRLADPSGYVVTRRGRYRAAHGDATKKQTTVVYADDHGHKQRRLGYEAKMLVVPKGMRPLPRREGILVEPRGGAATATGIVAEYKNVEGLAAYAGLSLSRPSEHPRSRQLGTLLYGTEAQRRTVLRARAWNSNDTMLASRPLLQTEQVPQPTSPVFKNLFGIANVAAVDVEKALKWSPRSGVKRSKDDSEIGLSVYDDASLSEEEDTAESRWRQQAKKRRMALLVRGRRQATDLHKAAGEAKEAWRERRKNAILRERRKNAIFLVKDHLPQAQWAMRRAEEDLQVTHQKQAHLAIETRRKEAPMRLAAQFGSDTEKGLGAEFVRLRLQTILKRWVEEFEKAQCAVALALWKIALLEGDRESRRVTYRLNGGRCRLDAYMQRCQRRTVSRFFSRLVSRTGWLIFGERSRASLKIQTAHRRHRDEKIFVVRHDASPFGGFYSDIGLAPERSLHFQIDPRVRAERRVLWFAAIVLQKQQRARAFRGVFWKAKRAAVLIQSMLRMFPVRALFLVLRAAAISIEAIVRTVFFYRRPFLKMQVALRVIQRYLRGDAGRRVSRSKEEKRSFLLELTVLKPDVIQKFWRSKLARKRVQSLHADVRELHQAALKLQLAWYRRNNGFSTFLLLGCLRDTDLDDKKYAHFLRADRRVKAQAKIRAEFKVFLAKKRIQAANKIAGAWQQFIALGLMIGKKMARWARRKLQCFYRVRYGKRMRCASKIAFKWWKSQPGRFLRHLEVSFHRIEQEEHDAQEEREEEAASTIQAVMHGQLARSARRKYKASLKVQTRLFRGPLGRLLAERTRIERRNGIIAGCVDASFKFAMLRQRELFKGKMCRASRRIQRAARGVNQRCSLTFAVSHARSCASGVTVIGRAARAMLRLRHAKQTIAVARRTKMMSVKTVPDIFVALEAMSAPPDASSDAWDWVDFKRTDLGMTALTFCRRSGCRPESFEKVRGFTLRGLAAAAKKRNNNVTSSVADDLLKEPRRLAAEFFAGGSSEEDRRPLGDDTKMLVSVVACSRFSGIPLKRRATEGLKTPLRKLPLSAQKLVETLPGKMPGDASPGMIRAFLETHRDAEGCRLALEAGVFQRVPWGITSGIISRAEKAAELRRLQKTRLHRRAALEKILTIFTKDARSLRSRVEDALRQADTAEETLRTRKIARRRRRKKKKKQEEEEEEDDPPELMSKLFAPPELLPLLSRCVPIVMVSEASCAAAYQCWVFESALNDISAKHAASLIVQRRFKSRHARQMVSLARHARVLAIANAGYLAQRRGEFVRRAWLEDMLLWEKEQAAIALDYEREALQAEAQGRLSGLLRLGWRQIQLPLKKSVDKALRQREDDSGVVCCCFERLRPQKPTVTHRIHAAASLLFRDDDAAREGKRIILQPFLGDNNPDDDSSDDEEEAAVDDEWRGFERERVRDAPLYDLEDDSSALRIQSTLRRLWCLRVVRTLKRGRRLREREAREREAWAAKVNERSRHVTVRCSLDYAGNEKPVTPEEKEVVNGGDPQNAYFVEAASSGLLRRGDHVVARYQGTPDNFWYPATVLYSSNSEFEGVDVAYEDGDVGEGLPLSLIRLPRFRVGDTVEAAPEATTEELLYYYYPARILDVEMMMVEEQEDSIELVASAPAPATAEEESILMREVFRVAYEDGEVGEGLTRSRLRCCDVGRRLEDEAREAQKAAISAKKMKRAKARALRLQRLASREERRMASLKLKFAEARLKDNARATERNFRTLAPASRPLDLNAMNLADMVRCSLEATEITRPRIKMKISIVYTRVPLRFGWEEHHKTTEDDASYYTHSSSNNQKTTTWERPGYGFEEERAARHLMDAIRAFLTHRRKVRELTQGNDLVTLVKKARSAARLSKWTTPGDEKPPLDLWLLRRGFAPATVATVVKRARQQDLDTVQDRLLRLLAQPAPKMDSREHKKEDRHLEAMGFTSLDDRRWLRKSNCSSSARGARFLGFWRSPTDDARDLSLVLQESKPLYAKELARHFRNVSTRCDHMATRIAEMGYPVSYFQLDRLAHDFAGKPAAAQEALKSHFHAHLPQSTGSAQEELQALRGLYRTSIRFKAIAKEMKIETLALKFNAALTKCRELVPEHLIKAAVAPPQNNAVLAMMTTKGSVVKEVEATNEELSVLTATGAASRASWLLDVEVMAASLRAWTGATLAQTYTRRRIARSRYLKLRKERLSASVAIQCFSRTVVAVRLRELFLKQQVARWHMLWDPAARTFYYLNLESQATMWEEPLDVVYRPQVKDRFTGQFILAWPQLERPQPLKLQQPKREVCMQCKLEKSTRRCLECPPPKFQGHHPTWGDGSFHFCFGCFASHHDNDARSGHNFELTRPTSAPALICVYCGDLATRRCRGLRVSARGRALVHRFVLQHATNDEQIISARQLRATLRLAGVPMSADLVGELHAKCTAEANIVGDLMSRLACYHETLVSELDILAESCSDDYCAEHWVESHSKGTRAWHTWTGFEANAPVCAICEARPARLDCGRCEDLLCEPCASLVHVGKKQHVLTEVKEEGPPHCSLCGFRSASEDCTLCGQRLCDSCFAFEHDAVCAKRGTAKEAAQGVDPDHPTKCVVCGRKPERRCLECDDVYCMWMGKPRCFYKTHAKGDKRKQHTLLEYTFLDDLDEKLKLEEQQDAERLDNIQSTREKAADDFKEALAARREVAKNHQRRLEKAADEVLAAELMKKKSFFTTPSTPSITGKKKTKKDFLLGLFLPGRRGNFQRPL